ncbi:MAG: oligosaccharide flippase family protein, partial [Candidatus Krumholzibacteriota bacterium]|nr:oligosaccharide flippase family protein [Candidatus Krumholzibacteriota bacterium]
MKGDFSQYKNVLKHSVIYGFGNLSTKIVGFLLLPVFTKFLLPADYGVLEIITITSSIIVVILNFGMSTAIFKSYFNYDSEKKRRLVISSAFYFCVTVTVILSAAMLSGAPLFSRVLFGNTDYIPHFRLMILSSFFAAGLLVPLAVLRAEERSFLYICFTFSQIFLMLMLNIYFVVVLKLGVLGILLGGAISGCLIYLTGLIFVFRKIKWVFSRSELKLMLTFGTPLIAASLANKVLTGADRYLLKYLSDLHEVGLYSLGYKISSIMIVFVVQPFSLAWPVIMFKLAREEGAAVVYRNVLTYFITAASLIALGLSVFSREVITLLAPPVYRDAYQVVPLLTLSLVLSGAFYIVGVGLNLERKTGYFPVIIGCAALFNVFANYLLIPRYGMRGASLATVITQVLI